MTRAHDLLARLRAEGVIGADGRAGTAARRWSPGSFARLAVDDPGRVTLYSNRQGGFRVVCPVVGRSIVPAFEAAVTAWRRSGPRELRCPACGEVHALDDVSAAPPIAFGRFALVTFDVEQADLTAEALRWVDEELGSTRMVARRG